jgi:hypothetical protein
MSDAKPEFEQHIRERAYFLWQAEGCPDGRSMEFWDRARALDSEAAPAPGDPRPGPAEGPRLRPPGDGPPRGVPARVQPPLRDRGPSSPRTGPPEPPPDTPPPRRHEPRWTPFFLALAVLLAGMAWVDRRPGPGRDSRGMGRGRWQVRWKRMR